MKSIIFLSMIQLGLGAGLLPISIPNILQGLQNPNACTFNGPQDSQTLRGQNFIENFGTGSCLTLKKLGNNNLPIELESCTWNRLPISSQLFEFKNGNGGLILKPTVSGVFGAQTCVATRFGGSLTGKECSVTGKDFDQTWKFTKIRANLYQITQLSTGMCLRVDSVRTGATSTLVRCNSWDNFQLWRICTSK